MPAASLILADSVGLKLIPFVIFLIIWGLGSLASVVNKAKEEAKRREAMSRMARGQMPPSPQRPIAAAAPRRVASMAPLPPLSHIARPAAAPARRAAQVRPAPQPQPMAPAVHKPAPAARPEPPPARPPATASTRATAPAIRRWLNPATLRSQYILTEVLQPPLGLRPPQEP